MKNTNILLFCIFLFFILQSNCASHVAFVKTKKLVKRTNIEIVTRKYIVTSPRKILLMGDSMAYFLGFRLNDYCEKNNHDMYCVTWVSGTTGGYAKSDTIQYFINNFGADYIIFVIGSNELFYYDIPERQKYVETIIAMMGDIPNIWIGPPNWKEDTGINQMMLEVLGEDRFFLSKKLTFERQAEGDAHPSRRASEMWFDSVAVWIMRDSKYPIILEKPDNKSLNPIKGKTLVTRYYKKIVTDSI